MQIRNTTESVGVWCGQEIGAGETYVLQAVEKGQWAADARVQSDLQSGALVLRSLLTRVDLKPKTALATLAQSYPMSLAVDRNSSDLALSGSDWVTVPSTRVLWDIHADYDSSAYDLVVPFDGIYFHDGQFRVVNLVGVTQIELAVFKRLAEGDDYWFMLDLKEIVADQTEAQLSSATLFDFYEDERYCLKIKLSGTEPQATLDGDDDYTAWGFSFQHSRYS